MTLMTKSHSVVSSVDLGSNFNFAILVLIMLSLVSQTDVWRTSTAAGSCTQPKLAGSIAQESNHVWHVSKQFKLVLDMTIKIFLRWRGTTCMQPGDKTRMCKNKKKGTKHKIQLNQTCLHRLHAGFWFLNRFAGAGQKVTVHSCAQACIKIRHPKYHVWSAFSLGNGNLVCVSQSPVFAQTHFDLPRSGPQRILLFGPWMKQFPVHRWIGSQEPPRYFWGLLPSTLRTGEMPL